MGGHESPWVEVSEFKKVHAALFPLSGTHPHREVVRHVHTAVRPWCIPVLVLHLGLGTGPLAVGEGRVPIQVGGWGGMGSVCGSGTPSVSRLDQASTAAASKPPFPALQRCTRRNLPRNTRPGVRLRATQRAGMTHRK